MSEPVVDAKEPPPRTPLKEWVRLIVLWLACAAATGLIPGQAMFVGMFAKAGVFGGMCEPELPPCSHQSSQLSAMFGTGAGMTAVFYLPAGMLFDAYGARWCAVVGTSIVFVGLACEGAVVYSALTGADAYTRWLVLPGAVVTDIGSVMSSFTLLGLVWHFPGSQTLIVSLIMATYQVSAMFPIVLQWIMDWTGISLACMMAGYAVCVLALVPLMYLAVPSQEEYYSKARAVLGVPLPKPTASLNICKRVVSGLSAVKADMGDHMWFAFCLCFASDMSIMYSSNSFAYGDQLFGTEGAGDSLAEMQVSTVALTSVVLSPLAATMTDWIGLRNLLFVMTAVFIVPSAFFARPDWWAAWVTTWGYSIYAMLNGLLQTRYPLQYAPPSRLGSYIGMFNILLAGSMLPVYFAWFGFIMALPEDNCFFLPYTTLIIVSVAGWAIYGVRACFAHGGMGFPALPTMLPEDEVELCMPFGAAHMAELAEITGLDAKALLRRMSDQDPASMQELRALVSIEKVARVARNRDADAVIRLLEAAPERGEEEEGAEGAAGNPPLSKPPLLDGASPEAVSAKDGAAVPAARAEALARDLKAAFYGEATGAGAALLLQSAREEEDGAEGPRGLRARALAECFAALVAEGSAGGCKQFLLSVPVEDQMKFLDAQEDLMGEQRSAALDVKFSRLVPPKEQALLVKQKPDLKAVMTHFMMRDMRKGMGKPEATAPAKDEKEPGGPAENEADGLAEIMPDRSREAARAGTTRRSPSAAQGASPTA